MSCRSKFEADLAVSVVSFSFINNSLCFGMFNVYMDSDYPFGIFKLFFICMLYVRSYPVRGEMYSIQHNVIQFIGRSYYQNINQNLSILNLAIHSMNVEINRFLLAYF